MCDATFTFGQRGSHFYQCPSRRDYTRIPKKLQRLLTSKDLSTVHHVTLGFDHSFLITYRTHDGNDHIESQGLPDELNDFLYAFLYAKNASSHVPLRNIPQLRLTLGPQNESFFVHDKSSYLWLNLPSNLLKAIQARIKGNAWVDKPRLVALGADDNFLLITTNNAAVWDLPDYDMMSDMIEYSKSKDGGKGIAEITNVTLHAYRYQGFVAMSRNGTLVGDNLPTWGMEGLAGMKGPVVRDCREEEVRKRQRDLVMRPKLSESRSSNSGRNDALKAQVAFRREWTGKEQQFKAQAKGLKLSLSLSVGIGTGGLTKILG